MKKGDFPINALKQIKKIDKIIAALIIGWIENIPMLFLDSLTIASLEVTF